ncbi:MAG: TerB family tellurite resistance protein [Deltaproteobacteria bacterium]|nr:TerB family tellurite resistance protein [Deltaproteobacteria bacterium]
MAMTDRIVPLCDLLLGAAYADKELKDQERDEVRALLEELAGELPTEVELRLSGFDPATFDLETAAAPFRGDTEDERKKLLVLVSAVNESDEEIDFSEDDYLRDLAKALGLPKKALEGLTMEIEQEEDVDLTDLFAEVRKGPPPPPKKK